MSALHRSPRFAPAISFVAFGLIRTDHSISFSKCAAPSRQPAASSCSSYSLHLHLVYLTSSYIYGKARRPSRPSERAPRDDQGCTRQSRPVGPPHQRQLLPPLLADASVLSQDDQKRMEVDGPRQWTRAP